MLKGHRKGLLVAEPRAQGRYPWAPGTCFARSGLAPEVDEVEMSTQINMKRAKPNDLAETVVWVALGEEDARWVMVSDVGRLASSIQLPTMGWWDTRKDRKAAAEDKDRDVRPVEAVHGIRTFLLDTSRCLAGQ